MNRALIWQGVESSMQKIKKYKRVLLAATCLSFIFCPLLFSSSMLYQAETLFKDGLYEDALPLYEALSKNALVENEANMASTRLAECYLEMQKPEEALYFLKAPCTSHQSYLLAVTYRKLASYEKALLILNQLEQSPEVCLEKGLNYFYLKNSTLATASFQHPILETHTSFYPLSLLYLTHLALLEGKTEQAQMHLLSISFPQKHSLFYKQNYLQGLLFFLKHKYDEAIFHFEKVLVDPNKKRRSWYGETLNYLLQSNLKKEWTVASSPFSCIDCEHLANELLVVSKKGHFHLTAIQYYLYQGLRTGHPETHQKIGYLLDELHALSPDSYYKALLSLAKEFPSYKDREELYTLLTQETYVKHVLYPEAWLARGTNDFDEARRIQQSDRFHEKKRVLDQAVYSFSKAYPLFVEDKNSKAAWTLKYKALAYQQLGTEEGFQHSLQTFDQLFQDPNLLASIEDRKELYYLYAYSCMHLCSTSDKSSFIKTLKAGLSDSTDSPFHFYLVRALALFYFHDEQYQQANDLLNIAAQSAPIEKERGEFSFWRIKCEEKLNKDQAVIQQHYADFVLNYPDHPNAGEAYFNCYSYRQYLQGGKEEHKHLREMANRFPQHPLTILAYYLIGLDQQKHHLLKEDKVYKRKNLTGAIDAFQEAETTFQILFQQDKIPPSEIAYYTQIAYLSILERASSNLAIAEESLSEAKRLIYLNYAIDVFEQLQSQLIDDRFLEKNVLSHLWEEALFKEAQAYVKLGNSEKACALFDTLISHFKDQKTAAHPLYSKAWYQKGLIAMQQEQYGSGIDYLCEAEQTAKGLTPDETLDIWIQQSICYKKQQQMSKAMRILSKVVNADMISSLRLKAMFMRAEIYELQGRPELAIKQLEATATKGGEWGKKAQEKLEQDYGY